ncbi:MAG: glycerol-3-phosphate dehydrogenase/oxidase [Candidatus Dormibacteria bacterium]
MIGGGVTGTGVARDAAMRGLSVLLVEKDDFGQGTSGASSGMVHGGLRYLEYDWRTSQLSCQDAGFIHRLAGHLLFRVAFLIPVLDDDKVGMEKMETALEAYDRFQPLKDGKPHVRLRADEARSLEPGLTPRLRGALTMDEWGVDPFRLCFLNALSAAEAGATVWNHAKVTSFLFAGRRVVGARVRRDGAEHEVRALMTVNAAGPWNEAVAGMAGVSVRLRPAKGVHLVLDRRVTSVALTAEARDGRELLLVPHENTTLLGTTDDDFFGDLDHLEVTRDECAYITEAFERVLPGISDYRVINTTVGVRPTLYAWRRNEDDLSREYEVFDHQAREGLAGLITIAGGKLSMFRLMAQDTVDAVTRQLARAGRLAGQLPVGTTHLHGLPGVDPGLDPAAEASELAARHGVGRVAASRLVYRHGTRAAQVLASAAEGARVLVCRTEPVTEAEIRHAARHEWVRDLSDLERRTRLAHGACQGLECAGWAASILGEELGWSASQVADETERFRRAAWERKVPGLTEASWAQEELNRAAWAPGLVAGG